jgi:hypothetical protein
MEGVRELSRKSHHFIEDLVSRSVNHLSDKNDNNTQKFYSVEPVSNLLPVNSPAHFGQYPETMIDNSNKNLDGFDSNIENEQLNFIENMQNQVHLPPNDNNDNDLSKSKYRKKLTHDTFLSTKTSNTSNDVDTDYRSDTDLKHILPSTKIDKDYMQTDLQKLINTNKFKNLDNYSSSKISPPPNQVPKESILSTKSPNNLSVETKSFPSMTRLIKSSYGTKKIYNNDTPTSNIENKAKFGFISLPNSLTKKESVNQLESMTNTNLDKLSLASHFTKTNNVIINIDRIEVRNSNLPTPRSLINAKSNQVMKNTMSLQEYMKKRLRGEF